MASSGSGTGIPIESGDGGGSMTLTRANAEGMILARTSPLLTTADMDGTTEDGSNADLNYPVGRAISDLGYTVSDVTLVTDADVAQVIPTQEYQFLDTAVLRTLESILGNLDDVDIKSGPRDEKLNQLAQQVERMIEKAREMLAADYGFGLSTPVAGVINLDFAEHGI